MRNRTWVENDKTALRVDNVQLTISDRPELFLVWFIFYFIIIFGKFVETIDEMEQNISGQGVRIGLCATLGIDDTSDVGALGKKVVSVDDTY